MRTMLMSILMLAAAPFAVANEQPAWQGADSDVLGLETPHPQHQRLHERKPAFLLDWDSARRLAQDFAGNVVCELGVLSLALPHCADLAEIVAPAMSPAPAPAPDWQLILRRPVEQRMQSI